MNTVCMIIPYFGKFPNYFQLWMMSASFNQHIDFLIFTDNERPDNLPCNIKWYASSLKEIKDNAQKLVDFKICLEQPYKLCDYRPAYGEIFHNFIKEYKWWGFCDLDVILGDLSPYTNDCILGKYEKILELGSFTLVKNTKKMNSLWKVSAPNCWTYREAFRYPESFHFDEGGGFSFICAYSNIKCYSELPNAMTFADIDPFANGFQLSYNGQNKKHYIFCWENGKIFGITSINDGDMVKTEFTYLHLQKRKMKVNIDASNINSSILITPNTFQLLDSSLISSDFIDSFNDHHGLERKKISLRKRISKWKSYGYLYCKIIKYCRRIPSLGNETYFNLLTDRRNGSDGKTK